MQRTGSRTLAPPPQLDATVKVCRACQNGAQRLYHIGRLSRVAVEAASGAFAAFASLHSRQSLALRRAAPRAPHHTRRSALSDMSPSAARGLPALAAARD
jgi:hypothetical protein